MVDTRKKPEPSTYWILRRDQIQCLASSRRQAILDRLAAAGPLAVRDLAPAVGLNPPAAYPHLKRLLEVGLVVEAGTRVANRRAEKLYAAVAPRMRLARALSDPDLKDVMKQVVGALTRQMDRDFSAGIEQDFAESTGPGRNLGFFRLVGAPGPPVLEKINRHLQQISELLWDQGDDRAPLVALGWTLCPVGPPADGRARP